jgi:hypothetical protein
VTPRAALVPLRALGSLDGLGEVLSTPALAVSLRDEAPSHVLVVAEALSPAFAASAVHAGGRLLFARPDATCFAEGDSPLPEPVAGAWTLRLRDVPDPLVARGTPAPLERFLSVSWSPAPDRTNVPDSFVRVAVELRETGEARPAAALVLRGSEIDGLEETLWTWPESRFDGVSFAFDGRELLLAGEALDGLAGAPFHAVPLDGGRTLLLPAGRRLEPAFARAWLGGLLGPSGDLFLWREDGIQAVDRAALRPLTRRAWRCHGR